MTQDEINAIQHYRSLLTAKRNLDQDIKRAAKRVNDLMPDLRVQENHNFEQDD